MDETAVFPVITLYQPWAAYVAMGYKLIETRLHNRLKCLEGKQILIHAARNIDYDRSAWDNRYILNNHGEEALNWALKLANIRGAIVASCMVSKFSELNDTHSQLACIDCGTVKRFGLFLGGISMFDEPQYVQGSMGIWYYDVAKQEKVRKPALV